MVRRRPSRAKGKFGPRPVDHKDARIKKWNKASDVPLDEEDQFHASRDRILLDGEGGDDDEDEGDEVFALKGMLSDDSNDEGNEDGGMDTEDEDEEEYVELTRQTEAKSNGKGKGKAQTGLGSDEEGAQEESEEETWGKNKSAYYAADEVDSDDEEANELEEQEARRLQARARDVMEEDDFGLGDAGAVDTEETVVDFVESVQVAVQPLQQDKKSLIRHLEKTSPETLALANDWEDTALKVVKAQNRIQRLESDAPGSLGLGMMHLHYQALLTYATNLAFYLHLRAGEHYAPRPDALRMHPIFGRLVQLKEAVSTLEDLDFDASDTDVDSNDDSALLDEDDDDDVPAPARTRKLGRRATRMDLEELAALLREAEDAMTDTVPVTPPTKRAKDGEPAKKKRKTRADAAPTPVFDLVEPEFVPAKRALSTAADPADVFGDAATLATADAVDKRARKHTLRFHTARIEGATARRQGARAALGGDDDVPYRERRREREARKLREAVARGTAGQGGDDLDAEEPGPVKKEKGKERAEEGSDDEGADGYYSLIQRQKKERKEQKKVEHDAAVAAARIERETDDSADGPRALTRAILANRGLTPHRSKSVRNPRVKKRERYEKAKKRLASQRAVFKEGPRDVTRYEGEKSGISKVVKSVRF
ncbi:Sas10 C-terminal domain-containing protein [Vararia minispora EC-137]|uniref:Sas10 C-terminal domain-containing protein n=1 Tax=Vararia minispora EC-137 TaxID=1314806 RepID=A0ACB8QYJ7_9AGAM|nr:Sas10 C-terminal domain-containing protein [Vararia minispora EC-137]